MAPVTNIMTSDRKLEIKMQKKDEIRTALQSIAWFFSMSGRYRTRTCDLLHVKQMLYQLS